MNRLWGALIVVALMLGTTAAVAAVKEVMAEADRHYAEREKAGRIDQAIETYQQVLALDDSVVDAYWKIARAYYFKGTQAKSGAADAYREGIEFAKLAIAVDPKSVASHFWLAVSYGKFGETKGIMQSLHLVDPLMKEAETALKLEPCFEQGGPHRVLCRVYLKLPGFKGGSVDKALDHCAKAIACGPKEPMNHVFAAEALLEKGDKAKAKEHLQTVLALPVQPQYAPEHKEQKAEAKKMLEKLGD